MMEVIETTQPESRPFREIVDYWHTPRGHMIARLTCGHTRRITGLEIEQDARWVWCRRCESDKPA